MRKDLTNIFIASSTIMLASYNLHLASTIRRCMYSIKADLEADSLNHLCTGTNSLRLGEDSYISTSGPAI